MIHFFITLWTLIQLDHCKGNCMDHPLVSFRIFMWIPQTMTYTKPGWIECRSKVIDHGCSNVLYSMCNFHCPWATYEYIQCRLQYNNLNILNHDRLVCTYCYALAYLLAYDERNDWYRSAYSQLQRIHYSRYRSLVVQFLHAEGKRSSTTTRTICENKCTQNWFETRNWELV